MDPTWPDDIWINTFDIKPDGTAEVEYDIVMAVPEHEPRPIDYLNFSTLEADFRAFDVLTGEALKIEEQIRGQRKTVYVSPHHELLLGEKYRYKLKFRMPQGPVRNISDHHYSLEWGWGNWPLEYTLRFLLPGSACVYHASNNLVETSIIDNRPVLLFKGRSEHNTSIHIQSLFYYSDKANIQLLDFDDGHEKSYHCELTYDINDDLSIRATLKIHYRENGSKKLSAGKMRLRGKESIDLPMTLLGRNYSQINIYEGKTGKALKYKLLPILINRSDILQILRIFPPIYHGEIEDIEYCIDFSVGNQFIIRLKDISYLATVLAGFQASWDIVCLLPPKVEVFFVNPKPVEAVIHDGRPRIHIHTETKLSVPAVLELLFENTDEAAIIEGYRYLRFVSPTDLRKGNTRSLSFDVVNTTPEAVDILVDVELSGFEEETRTRRFISVKPGESRQADIWVTPKENYTKGNVRFAVYAGEFPPDFTRDYEISFQPEFETPEIKAASKRKKIRRTAFISYSSQDTEFVGRLVSDLMREGVDVWIDEWDIEVGDSIVEKVQEGIKGSEYLVIVLTPNSVQSEWVRRQLNTALMHELESKRVKVLPVLAFDCDVPEILKEKLYSDLRGDRYRQGLEKLIKRLRNK